MCQTRLQLQSYKKYLKYTMILCKIYIHNKYFTKKSEKVSPLALRKFILWLISKALQRYKKYSIQAVKC